MSIYDELLLSTDQLTRLKQVQTDYKSASEKGDREGMAAAHRQAEQIRNSAGYSGGANGSDYQLLDSGASVEGYSPYEKMVRNYATSGMQGIASGYQNTIAQLQKEREAIEQEAEQNQGAARSAVWSAQRLADDGLLARGLENTGLADVITATTLNQAAANAYRALLERQDRLRAADLAAIDAKANALGQVGDLQKAATTLLTDGYSDFFEGQAEREHEQQMDDQNHRQDVEMNRLNYENDYRLNEQKHEQDSRLSRQEFDQDSALSTQKHQQDSALSSQEHRQDSALSNQEYAQDSALSAQEYQQDTSLATLAHQFDIDLSKLNAEQKRQLENLNYEHRVAIEKLKNQWASGNK